MEHPDAHKERLDAANIQINLCTKCVQNQSQDVDF